MDKIVKVEKRPDLVKDLKNGGVINTDTARYLEHKRILEFNRRNIAEKNALSETVTTMHGEINNLKKQYDDLKGMIQILLDRK
jgi:hypothetical protein